MTDMLQNLQQRQLADRYQLEEQLAQGGMSVVYRGQDTVLRRPIAVKAVAPKLMAAYRDAFHATSGLSHPAVVATYDAVEEDGWLYIVQEYLQARPLSAYMSTGVPSERAVDLAGQIARVLAYAHAHGIPHGDLHPSAILIDRRAVAHVNNFGLPPDAAYFAALEGALEPHATDTPAGNGNTHAASPSEDVRALGLLLWQLLRNKDAEGAAAFRADVHADLAELVRRCVVRSHPNRLENADTVVIELEQLARTLAAARPAVSEDTPPVLQALRAAVAQEAPWSAQSTHGATRRRPPTSGRAGVGARAAHSAPTDAEPTAPWTYEGVTPLVSGMPRLRLPSRPIDDVSGRRLASTDPVRWSRTSPLKHDDAPTLPIRRMRVNLGVIVALALLLFALFFIFGYLAPPLLGQP